MIWVHGGVMADGVHNLSMIHTTFFQLTRPFLVRKYLIRIISCKKPSTLSQHHHTSNTIFRLSILVRKEQRKENQVVCKI